MKRPPALSCPSVERQSLKLGLTVLAVGLFALQASSLPPAVAPSPPGHGHTAECSGAKGPLQVRVVPSERSGPRDGSISAELEIGLAVPAQALVLTGSSTGIGRLDEPQLRLEGPFGPGTVRRLPVEVSFAGTGTGEAAWTVTAIGPDGARIAQQGTRLFLFDDEQRIWSDAASADSLQLMRLEELVAEGTLPEDVAQERAEAILYRPALTDSARRVPRPATDWEESLEKNLGALGSLSNEGTPEYGSGAYTFSGRVLWSDRAGVTHPLRLARIEIRDDELLGSDLIATTTTDAQGDYSITFSADDGIGQGDPDLFVRVLATSTVAYVEPDGLFGSTYGIDSVVQDELAAGSYTVNLTAGKDASGATDLSDAHTAFSIHASMIEIAGYTSFLAGAVPPQIQIEFPDSEGSEVYPGLFGTKMQILLGDRFDWDLLHHEYGHHVQNTFNISNSPGGYHQGGINLSADNGEGVALGKDAGLRLAWGEGWATYFGIAGQVSSGMSSLGIGFVGDRIYHDANNANDIPASQVFALFHLESDTGVGEDDEVSVMTVMWDLYDTTNDGDDALALGDKFLFTAVNSSKPTTVGALWEAVVAGQSNEFKAKAGSTFAQAEIAPEPYKPADDFAVTSTAPPEFAWFAKGAGAAYPLNDFRIVFFDEAMLSVVFEKDLGDVTSWTPTAEEWSTILSGDAQIHWVVQGRATNAPESPGGAEGYYWSAARSIRGIAIAFVIDDTGSMAEEIEGVKSALDSYIDLVASNVDPGAEAPTVMLVSFKDSVTERIVSNDLAAVKAAVAGLVAGGGGSCPESSAQALEYAGRNVSSGGTILLATDASTNGGVSISSVISDLKAKGVKVNTILSGDCNGISAAEMPPGAALAAVSRADQPVPIHESGPQNDDGEVLAASKPGGNDAGSPSFDEDGELQDPIDDHGDTAATATFFDPTLSGIVGSVGGTDDPSDFVAFDLEAGKAYVISYTVFAEGGGASFRLLSDEGLSTWSINYVTPGNFYGLAFSPFEDGTFYIEIEPLSGGGQSFYRIDIAEDALFGLTSSVELFSTISAETGGGFSVLDDVNFGEYEKYENAVFNIMASTVQPTLLSALPAEVPQGVEIALTLTGAETNWTADTQFTVAGEGVTVLKSQVTSATSAVVTVRTEESATLDFVNVFAETLLGGEVESASGLGIVEITPQVFSPTVLAATPSSLDQGDTAIVELTGLNTAWNESTSVSFGAGVEVESLDVLSPTSLRVQVAVAEDAPIGYRNASVISTGAFEVLDRALFVFFGGEAVPAVIDVSPAAVTAGAYLELTVTASGTNFVDGSTTADFGPGVDVVAVQVLSPTSSRVTASVSPAAAVGFRSLSLVTGAETAVLINGLFIGPGAGVVGDLAESTKMSTCLTPGGEAFFAFEGVAGQSLSELVLSAFGDPDGPLPTVRPSLVLRLPSGEQQVLAAAAEGAIGPLVVDDAVLTQTGTHYVILRDTGGEGGCVKARALVTGEGVAE